MTQVRVLSADVVATLASAVPPVASVERSHAGVSAEIAMMAADDATFAALQRVLARRGSAACVIEETARPKLASGLDGKAYLEAALSSGTRKKLRQYRRRLAEKGAVTFTIADQPAA